MSKTTHHRHGHGAGAGTDVAAEADIVLVRSDPRDIPKIGGDQCPASRAGGTVATFAAALQQDAADRSWRGGS